MNSDPEKDVTKATERLEREAKWMENRGKALDHQIETVRQEFERKREDPNPMPEPNEDKSEV